MTPLFSILHTSARPHAWRAVYDDWMSKCVDPSRVEYVLCIDERWGFSLNPDDYDTPLNNILLVQNTMRRCYVDGVNIAAKASTGSILIVNADDQFAADGWDESLLHFAQTSGSSMWKRASEWLNFSFVIEVSTGTPNEHERGIMVMPILSRARYEQQGWVLFVGYESMFADNDFCEAAKQDGVVIDARHLMFPHRHVMFDGKGGWKQGLTQDDLDAAYKVQNRGEAFQIGAKTLENRRLSGFPPMQYPSISRSIVLCIPGERFEGPWVDAILALHGHLIALGFSIGVARPSSRTNVYATRESIRRDIMNLPVKPELLLWIDDDNPLSVNHFQTLLNDLDAHPEVDGISGWCWIHREDKTGFMVSCGTWAPDHLHWRPFPNSEFVHARELREMDTGGMPCILMRLSALEKAGDNAFLSILDNSQQFGMSGEDIAFFKHAEAGGAKFLVDPRVRVPHLKYVEVEPTFTDEGRVPVKVACMIRARNEARWIGRTIESVKALCGDHVYVMEDGSTDNTRLESLAHGAAVIESPFEGQGLDERRDKNWFLARVKELCSPDWIIMLDGDEELQPGGCEIIRRELEKNPAIDVLALGVLNLWDSVDQMRVDGVYRNMSRQSLFRANSGLEFRSFYEGEGANTNHVGLHCSNAPGLGVARPSYLAVFIYHYGPLHRADRILKYEWMLKIDPQNETEGFYIHMVIGDLPQFPASIQVKHGGPLKLEKLPPRLVPKWDGEVPGPLESLGRETKQPEWLVKPDWMEPEWWAAAERAAKEKESTCAND